MWDRLEVIIALFVAFWCGVCLIAGGLLGAIMHRWFTQ